MSVLEPDLVKLLLGVSISPLSVIAPPEPATVKSAPVVPLIVPAKLAA